MCLDLPHKLSPYQCRFLWPKRSSRLHPSLPHPPPSSSPSPCTVRLVNLCYLRCPILWFSSRHPNPVQPSMGQTAGQRRPLLDRLEQIHRRLMPLRRSGPHWKAGRSSAPLRHPQTPSPASSTRHSRSSYKDNKQETLKDNEIQWRANHTGNDSANHFRSTSPSFIFLGLSVHPYLVDAYDMN